MKALLKSKAFAGSVVEMFEPPPPMLTLRQIAESEALEREAVQTQPSSVHAPQRMPSAGRTASDDPGGPMVSAHDPQRGASPMERAASSPTNKQFQCPKCGKIYQIEDSLRFHLRYA